MHLHKRIQSQDPSLGATTFLLPRGILSAAGLDPGWTRGLWCTARASSYKSLKGFLAPRIAEEQICSRKIHWKLSSVARSLLAWEAFEVQAAGGCRVPQMHHHTPACSHTPPPPWHWRQGRPVTFRSKGGPHRPVRTDEVYQRTRASQPGKALTVNGAEETYQSH